MDCGLWTADHGLQTGFKTWTRFKTRTVDLVGKNYANWF